MQHYLIVCTSCLRREMKLTIDNVMSYSSPNTFDFKYLWLLMTNHFLFSFMIRCWKILLTMLFKTNWKIQIQLFVVMGLLQLILINNKKQGVGFEERLGPFWSHDALRFSLTWSLLRLNIFISQIFKLKGVHKSDPSYVLPSLPWIIANDVT